MIQIRPVSDLRNKFSDIERAVGGGLMADTKYKFFEISSRILEAEKFKMYNRRNLGIN